MWNVYHLNEKLTYIVFPSNNMPCKTRITHFSQGEKALEFSWRCLKEVLYHCFCKALNYENSVQELSKLQHIQNAVDSKFQYIQNAEKEKKSSYRFSNIQH